MTFKLRNIAGRVLFYLQSFQESRQTQVKIFAVGNVKITDISSEIDSQKFV